MDVRATLGSNGHFDLNNAVKSVQKSRRKATPMKITIQQYQEEQNSEDSEEESLLIPQLTACHLCQEKLPTNDLEDIINNKPMKEALSTFLDAPIQELECSISLLCVRCIAKIRFHQEMRRKVKEKYQRLNGHNRKVLPNIGGKATKGIEETKRTEQESTHSIKPNHDQCADNMLSSPEGLPTPPFTADLSTPNTPETIEKNITDQIKCRQGTSTPTPPLDPCTNIVDEADVVTEEHASRSSQSQRSKSPYTVQVENITPVKDVENNEETRKDTAMSDSFTPIRSGIESNNETGKQLRSRSNSSQSENTLERSMLKVICERSESALVTESGGRINNYIRAPRVIQMVCQYCGRTYMRKDYYNKHIRRCQAQKRARTTSLTKLVSPQNVSPVIGNAKNNSSINRVSTPRAARVFHCTECPVTLENITELRRHKRSHIPQYPCETCESTFTTLHEHEFHRIICLAKQEAQREQEWQQEVQSQPDANTSRSTISIYARSVATTVGRRVTRSQSRAQSKAPTTPARPTRAKKRIGRVGSSVSQNTTTTFGAHTIVCDDEDSENEDEGVDDEVSVADSMYSKRRCFTGNWIDTRGSSGMYNMAPVTISSWKEYDLYLLDLFKAQIEAQFFYCLEADCNYTADNLLNYLKHDYIHHFKSSWFYCQKCGCVFTSKVFLDYHLDRQNGGRFICYKCNEEFVFQHQLDWHLIHHSKSKNFACENCNCEFLTEARLFHHTRNEHSEEMINNVIYIKSMIENVPPVEEDWKDIRRNYRECTRILRGVKKMPSNRPMQLPGHKPYRRRIGRIEFSNNKNPNCWSWK